MSGDPSRSKSLISMIFQGGGRASRVSVPRGSTPFMYQTMVSPVAGFLQRMSGLPSPLKSPTPTIFQGLPILATVSCPTTTGPFRYHIRTSPVDLFLSRMSGLPSPLKSPTPTTSQAEPGDVSSRCSQTRAVPYIYQTAISPVARFVQRMCWLPSPLKSPPPAIFQPGPLTRPAEAGEGNMTAVMRRTQNKMKQHFFMKTLSPGSFRMRGIFSAKRFAVKADQVRQIKYGKYAKR